MQPQKGLHLKQKKKKAGLANLATQGSKEALEQANEIWKQTFKLLNEEGYNYITQYFQNVNDMFSKQNKQISVVMKKI